MSSSSVGPSPSAAVHYDQWYYGVLLSVLASFVGGLGDNLVRYAHNAHRRASNSGGGGPVTVSVVEDYDAAATGSLRNSGVWSLGLLLTVVGNTVLTVWSLAFADASLIVPFAASHVIFTVVLAIFINDERLDFWSWTGIGLILGGTLLVVVESNKSSVDYDLDSILEFFMNPPFLSVCLAYFLIAAVCLFVFFRGQRVGAPESVQALCASVAAGLFGAFGSVMAKAVVEVFKQANRMGWGPLVRRQAMWGILAFTSIVAITQVVVYNAALKFYKASVVMPMVLATLTLFGTLLGAVFFEEFRRWSTLALVLLPIGVVVAFVGVIVLAIAGPAGGPGEKDEPDEPEEKKALLGGASL
eukprot:g2243.t1